MKSFSTASSEPATNAGAEPPAVANYELIRKIGRGGYGEVWLARSVTGTLRAIKIVRRQNFRSEKAFEREFEGIQRYERVSQDHSGLVDVLHVGRDESGEFYYYVMELADDVSRQPVENLEDYCPQTLARQLKPGEAMEVEDCLTLGELLAEALGGLHERGLAHRDVKPANIIYIRDKPRLADPGLVALTGQNTFVGTEGYVPPEGPGTTEADLYSLGIVLYEMNTGKDRMEFPELASSTEADPAIAEQRRHLNSVICRASAPGLKQRYSTATDFFHALKLVRAGRSPGPSRRSSWLPVVSGIALVMLGIWGAHAFFPGLGEREAYVPPEDPVVMDPTINPVDPDPVTSLAKGGLRVNSFPPMARVFVDGEEYGLTPVSIRDLAPETYEVALQKDGFKDQVLEVEVPAGKTFRVEAELDLWRPPVSGREWRNSLGLPFLPHPLDAHNHRSATPIRMSEFELFLDDMGDRGLRFEKGAESVIYADPRTRLSWCRWATERDRENGYLDESRVYGPEIHEHLDGSATLAAFYAAVGNYAHGRVWINSQPPGAEVYYHGRSMGRTPLELPTVETGAASFLLRMDGYRDAKARGTITHAEPLVLNAVLEPDKVQIDVRRPYTNSIGMKFVPMDGILCAIWETRVGDYDRYWETLNEAERSYLPDFFEQDEHHPVVNVRIGDARAFCEWLTEVERRQELIGPSWRYRLPTDLEWSRMAGLQGEEAGTPESRDSRLPEVYPWGEEFPPPAGTGNFADEALQGRPVQYRIANYSDGFSETAPVGSFEPNALGIHDLAGNVWEWVDDDYSGDQPHRYSAVMRGGSWADYDQEILGSSHRSVTTAEHRYPLWGFRVVLARESVDSE